MMIRRAKPHEASYLSGLALRSKGYWGYDAKFLACCKAELTYSRQDLQDNSFYLLEQQQQQQQQQQSNNIIIGFYALTKISNDVIELEALFIEPTHIGKGYGQKLMTHAMNESRKLGATKMKIVADPFAAKFYQRQDKAQFIGTVESESIQDRQLPCFQINL